MKVYKNQVIVLGSARSGTSWLSENLAKPFRYRMLFEPEHDERTTRGHLLTDQFFSQDRKPNKQADKYLKQIFSNRVDCDWIAQNSNRKYKMHLWPFIPKKYIIKFVRFNLSGAFLVNNYNIPVVHALRSPFEVIRSQKRVSFPWLFDFQYFKADQKLVDLVSSELGYDLLKIDQKSETEKLCVRWCIENVIPLQFQAIPSKNFHIVKHEDLRADLKVYTDLCRKLNLEVVPNIENEYKKPSSKTHPKSNIRGEKDQRNFVDSTEDELIRSLLKQFKQELYIV